MPEGTPPPSNSTLKSSITLSAQEIEDARLKSKEREERQRQNQQTEHQPTKNGSAIATATADATASVKSAADLEYQNSLAAYWQSEFNNSGRNEGQVETSTNTNVACSEKEKVSSMDNFNGEPLPSAKNYAKKAPADIAQEQSLDPHEEEHPPSPIAVEEENKKTNTASKPGAYAMTGFADSSARSEDSAVQQVLFALEEQQDVEALERTCRTSTKLDTRCSLVQADQIAIDAEKISYATDVQQDNFKRRMLVFGVIAIVVCVLCVSLVLGLAEEDDSPPICPHNDTRCCLSPNEMLEDLPNGIFVMCYCQNNTNGVYAGLSEMGRQVYQQTIDIALERDLIEIEDTLPLINTTSCTVWNQALLHVGLLSEKRDPELVEDAMEQELVFGDTLMATNFQLAALYAEMGGVVWTLDDWFSTPFFCMRWNGIWCNFLHTLSDIAFHNNYLQGTLSSVFGGMSTLRRLIVSRNPNVTGSIPAQFGNLTMLTELSLQGNRLTGSIPPDLGNLLHLNNLILGSNQITGAIPSQLFRNDSDLTALGLAMNQLEGSLPTEIGLLARLKNLKLDKNLLNGTLPTSMSQLTRLELLTISYNRFTGPIPDFLGNLPHLDRMDFYKSGLAGPLPETFCQGPAKDLMTRTAIVDCHENNTLCSCCSLDGKLHTIWVICGIDDKDAP